MKKMYTKLFSLHGTRAGLHLIHSNNITKNKNALVEKKRRRVVLVAF